METVPPPPAAHVTLLATPPGFPHPTSDVLGSPSLPVPTPVPTDIPQSPGTVAAPLSLLPPTAASPAPPKTTVPPPLTAVDSLSTLPTHIFPLLDDVPDTLPPVADDVPDTVSPSSAANTTVPVTTAIAPPLLMEFIPFEPDDLIKDTAPEEDFIFDPPPQPPPVLSPAAPHIIEALQSVHDLMDNDVANMTLEHMTNVVNHMIDIDEVELMNVMIETTELHALIENQRPPAATTLKQTKLRRSKLLRQPDWPKWEQAEDKMLDSYYDLKMYGRPVKKSDLSADARILRSLWLYAMKADGRYKARNVCDGTKRPGADGTVRPITLAATYAASMSQTEFRIFLCICAYLNWIVIGADATNAFAYSPPPEGLVYMQVDVQYIRWYNAKFPDYPPIDESYVLPVEHALQGHPESPRLFEGFINDILLALGFQNSVHAPCIYVGRFENEPMLLLRQVDDFAAGCNSEAHSRRLFALIHGRCKLVVEPQPMALMYGIDVLQTRDYIQIKMESYLTLMSHDYVWLQDLSPANVDQILPVSLDIMKKLDLAPLPTTDGAINAIQKQQGFQFRSLLGKCLFPMICGRCEVSFHISKLSQVMTRPAAVHFQALKQLAIYLVRTKHEGPIYWRTKPRDDLPVIPRIIVPLDALSRLSPWQPPAHLTTIHGRTQMDAHDVPIHSDWEGLEGPIEELALGLASSGDTDFAADLRHRRSFSGSASFLHGGLIDFKTRLQISVAQSSAEAEIGGLSDAAKRAIYIRHILQGMRIRPLGPTPVFVDNEAARLVSLATGTTKRLRHVDVQMFGVQDWQQKKKWVKVLRIAGSVNQTDQFTKGSNSLQTHSRHTNRLYGYHGPMQFMFGATTSNCL